MTATRTLAVIAWTAAIIMSAGAACLRPDVMGWAGVVAAIAALGWGLLVSLDAKRRDEWEHGRIPIAEAFRLRDDTWANRGYTTITVNGCTHGGRHRADDADDEGELPYRPVWKGETDRG